MGVNSNNQGRAYEYAWVEVLRKTLIENCKVSVVRNSSFTANEKAWNSISPELQNLFMISASSAVATFLELEPILQESGNQHLLLEFQTDKAGIHGDVRDIVIRRNDICWEIGLSLKHNHDAVKHSRLSKQLDFGKEWLGMPCSQHYWHDVAPIFNWLELEKAKKTKWSEIVDKSNRVYKPLLRAFMDEINRLYVGNKFLPRNIIEYLVGVKDSTKLSAMMQSVLRRSIRLTYMGR